MLAQDFLKGPERSCRDLILTSEGDDLAKFFIQCRTADGMLADFASLVYKVPVCLKGHSQLERVNVCIYIPHISVIVSWWFIIQLLGEIERQLVKTLLAAAISLYS